MEPTGTGFMQGVVFALIIGLFVVAVLGGIVTVMTLIKSIKIETLLNERLHSIQNQLQGLQTQLEVNSITGEDNPYLTPDGRSDVGATFITPDGKITATSLPELIKKIIEAGPEKSGYTEEQILRLKNQFEKLLENDDLDDSGDDADEPPFKS